MTFTIPFAETIWPDDGPGRTYLALTRGGVLRSLLPADSPRELRGSLARSNGPESRRRHLAREGAAVGADLRRRVAGSRGLVPIAGLGLEGLLSEIIGDDVRLAFHFGPPRANRKPVIQAFDGSGSLVAIAKLGVDDLTAGLVRNEARALRELAGRSGPTLAVPRLRALTTWSGRPLLVQDALPVPRRHVVPTLPHRSAAERELAGLATPRAPVSEYVELLRHRLEQLATPAPVELYLATVDLVAEDIDLDQWPSAPWHGDWSPQNLAVAGGARGTVAAWDWERFAHGRPLGFDTAHFWLQRQLADGRHTQPGVSLIQEAPALLAGWHAQDEPCRARGAATLLLLELAARYLADGQPGTGSPGSRVVDWTAPAMREFERLRRSGRGTAR